MMVFFNWNQPIPSGEGSIGCYPRIGMAPLIAVNRPRFTVAGTIEPTPVFEPIFE